MKRTSSILFGAFIFFVSIQSAQAQKEKHLSYFLYNFSKYIMWPDNQITDKFVIGVIGNSAINEHLYNMASDKKEIHGVPIEIKQYNSVSEIGDCHILYVPREKSLEIDKINLLLQSKSVLVVTDKLDIILEGGAINFVEEEAKMMFEVNQSIAESKGLKISESLIALAM